MSKNIPLWIGLTIIAFFFWSAVMFTLENPAPRTEPVKWHFPGQLLAIIGGHFVLGIMAGRRMR